MTSQLECGKCTTGKLRLRTNLTHVKMFALDISCVISSQRAGFSPLITDYQVPSFIPLYFRSKGSSSAYHVPYLCYLESSHPLPGWVFLRPFALGETGAQRSQVILRMLRFQITCSSRSEPIDKNTRKRYPRHPRALNIACLGFHLVITG